MNAVSVQRRRLGRAEAVHVGELVQLFERHQRSGLLRRTGYDAVLAELLPVAAQPEDRELAEVRLALKSRRAWSLREFLLEFVLTYGIARQRSHDIRRQQQRQRRVREERLRIESWKGVHETSPDSTDST